MEYILGGVRRKLDAGTIRRIANQSVPGPVDGRHKYYVNVEGHRYPVKQLFGLAARITSSEFITQDAIRVLTKLGFTVEEFARPSVSEMEAPNEASPSNYADPEAGQSVSFVVSLEPDEDGYILASCSQLPGCHSQGRSRQEALRNIEEAIHGYLASMKHHGEAIPRVDWDLVKVRV